MKDVVVCSKGRTIRPNGKVYSTPCSIRISDDQANYYYMYLSNLGLKFYILDLEPSYKINDLEVDCVVVSGSSKEIIEEPDTNSTDKGIREVIGLFIDAPMIYVEDTNKKIRKGKKIKLSKEHPDEEDEAGDKNKR